MEETIITSVQNARIKHVVALQQKSALRREEGLFVVEGQREIEHCIACGYDGPCVQKDDMVQIRKAVMESDMLVFATPLYFFGISAQLKTVIDRFCAFSSRINLRNMKSAFLSVAW